MAIYANKCHVCRSRKVKCGGEQPSCLRCISSNLTCTGYYRRLDVRLSQCQSREQTSSTAYISENQPFSRAVATIPDAKPERGKRPEPLEYGYIWIQMPSHAPQYRDALLGSLYTVYFPSMIAYATPHGSGGGNIQGLSVDVHQAEALVPAICSTWLHSACRLVTGPDAGALSDSLIAVAMTVAGASIAQAKGQDTVSHEARRAYHRALHRLRSRVCHVAARPHSELDLMKIVLTCLCCFDYEMIANRSFSNARRHLEGAGVIFQRLGPEGLTSELARDLFCEYRVADAGYRMVAPVPSFPSEEAWLNPSWKYQHPRSLQPLQTLLDLAYRIPPVIDQFHTLVAARTPARREAHCHEIQLSWDRAWSIRCDIEAWKGRLEENHRHRHPQESLYQTTFAAWDNRSVDPAEGRVGKIFPLAYIFSDLPIAASMTWYDAIQVCLAEYLIDMASHLRRSSEHPFSSGAEAQSPWPGYIDSPLLADPTSVISQLKQEILDRTTRICQSAEYFFAADKSLVGPICFLFPNGVAMRAFCQNDHQTSWSRYRDEVDALSDERSRQISWCRMIESKYHAAKLEPYRAVFLDLQKQDY